MPSEEEVRIVINAIDNASAALQQVKDSLENTAQSGQAVGQTVAAGSEKASEGLNKVQASARGAGDSLNAFGQSLNTIMQLGSLGMVGKGIDELFDKWVAMGLEGGQLANMQRRFDELAQTAGTTGEAMRKAFEQAAAGTVDASDMMEQYNRVMLMTGNTMSTQFVDMIKLARAASVQGYGDTMTLLTEISEGVGRAMARPLLAAGIKIDQAQAMEAYAASVHKTASELTTAEQQMAIWNAVVEAADKSMPGWRQGVEGAADGAQRLRVALKDLTDTAAMAAAPSINRLSDEVAGLSKILPPVIAEIAKLQDAMHQFGGMPSLAETLYPIPQALPAIQLVGGAFRELGSIIGREVAPELDRLFANVTLPPWVDQLAEKLGVSAEKAHGASAEVSDLTGKVHELGAAVLSLTDRDLQIRMHIVTEGLPSTEQQMWQQDIAAAPAGGLMGVHGTAGMGGNWTPAQQAALDEAYRQQQQLTDAQEEYNRALLRAADIRAGVEEPQRRWYKDEESYLKAHADWEISEAQRTASGVGGAYKNLASELESYAQSYKSSVSALLQPTQSTDFSKIEDQLGMHQDQWDEYARRMADIVKLGGKSPFAAMYGISDKGQALAEEKAFYSGQRLEQVNWDAVARQYQEQIQAKLGQQAMVDRAMQELSARGLGPEKSEVMKALGFQAPAQGADAASQWMQGFSDQWMGNKKALESAGKDGATWMMQAMASGAKSMGSGVLGAIIEAIWGGGVKDKVLSLLHEQETTK